MKRFKKLMAIIMVTALIMIVAAISASAEDTYTPVNGTNTQFNKYLVVDSDTNIPAISFNFTVVPGTPVAATSSTPAILAGVGSPSIATVTFTNGQATSTTAPSDLTLAAGKKFAVQTATVDFSGVSFTEPGVYRYVITEQETTGAKAVSYDTQAQTAGSKVRYLDVYVADVNNALTVSSYVMHETTAVVVNTDPDNKADDKSSSYVNEITTKDLEFGKEVIGNQGSKDKYFLYTLAITGAQANTTYSVDLTSAEASPAKTDATKYTSMTNPSSFTTNGDGEATVSFYLKDGQYIKIPGLPEGYGYTLTEDAEDYASSATISATNGKSGVAYSDPVTGSGVSADIKTGFTNERTGIIPTGVLLTIAPFAIGILLFGALIIFIIAKRRRNNY